MSTLRRASLVLAASALLTSGLASTAQARVAASDTVQAPQLQAACVQLVSWRNTSSTRYVTVRNTCGTKQCYKVDQQYISDPLLSVAAYATEEDSYSSTFFGQGRGIYGASCTG